MDFTFLIAPFEQIAHSPATAFVILPISIIVFMLEVWPLFPSRFVPWTCLLLGTILYPNLVKVETVPPSFPNPLLVLFLTGFVLGFVAYLFHAAMFKWLFAKYWPQSIPMPKAIADSIDNKKKNEP